MTTGTCSKAVMLASLLLSSVLPTTLAANVTSSSIAFPNDDVKLAINVPSGDSKQDLYFSFEAPMDHNDWAGFGLGTQMRNSLMFVAYRSADNRSVTLSTRLGDQHTMPVFTNAVNVSLLDGSSVSNNTLALNFHCIGCRDWGNGKLDVTSTSAPFFWALGPEGNLQSDDKEARIGQHYVHSETFGLDMKAATGPPGVPVIGSGNDKTSNSNNYGVSDGQGPSGNFGLVSRGVAAHGFAMGFAITIVFPGGYLFLRLFEKVWLHWVIQSFGVLCTILGFGSGIAVSIKEDLAPKMDHPHQIIGFITVFIVLAAWTLGLIGHQAFKRKGVPSPLMKGHRIAGPLAITLGFTNVCIGLSWVGRPRVIIGYVIFALLVVIVIGSIVFWKRKRTMRKNAMNSAAAYNFREGNTGYTQGRGGTGNGYTSFEGAPASHGQSVPMQTFGQQHHAYEAPMEHYSVQPNK